jgi:hypothetical protein
LYRNVCRFNSGEYALISSQITDIWFTVLTSGIVFLLPSANAEIQILLARRVSLSCGVLLYLFCPLFFLFLSFLLPNTHFHVLLSTIFATTYFTTAHTSQHNIMSIHSTACCVSTYLISSPLFSSPCHTFRPYRLSLAASISCLSSLLLADKS